MLRNLKVGTKLFVILLAPMLVILSLVAVGVSDRRATAANAQKAAEVATFAQAGTDLQAQLELEQVYTGMLSGSREQKGQDELAAQRERTDAAVERWNSIAASIDQSANDGQLAATIKQVQSGLSNLGQVRRSFDQGGTQPYSVSTIYGGQVKPLLTVNAILTGQASDQDFMQGLDASSRVQQEQAALADQSAILIGAAERGAFTGAGLQNSADPIGLACPSLTTDCDSFENAAQYEAAFQRAQEGLTVSSATVAQKQAVNDSAGLSDWQQLAARVNSQATTADPETGSTNVVTVAGDEMLASSVAAVQGLSQTSSDFTQDVIDAARSQEQSASRSVMLYLTAGAVGLAIAFAIAVVVARSITGPLSKLTKAADKLSHEQLPALVKQLRNPEDEEAEAVAESMVPIQVDSQDEIGELADAFNTIQAVTVDVAEEQGRLLRKGIGDIFVNLARRNQSLLDRQIEFIDQLEGNERDPDQLENLFKLDHLATRMRRNAESLLVMAGADPPRRRGAPVPVSDVVRVAIGEVEDYQRVHLLALDDATVAANVAADLAHLLSELMENATNASPPNTSVEVLGGYDARNGYVLTVADRGIGMSDAQIADANHHLAHPPMVGLVISRSLGLTVVGRLAARYGLAVRLETREEGGVTATVELPYGLVEYPEEQAHPAPSAIEVMAAAGGRATRPRRTSKPVAVNAGSTATAGNGSSPITPMPADAPLVEPGSLPRRDGAAPSQPEVGPTSSPASTSPASTSPASTPAPAPARALSPG